MSLKSLKELMILSTIRAHPLHGYGLADALDEGLGWTVGLTKPTVYATLKRFVERGWIEGELIRDSQMPEREVYYVTDDGDAAYFDLLESCAEDLTEGTHPVAALLIHLDELDDDVVEEALQELYDQRSARLELLRSFPEHDGLVHAALGLLTKQVQAEVDTLAKLL